MGFGNLILLFMISFEWRIVFVQVFYCWSNNIQEKFGLVMEVRFYFLIIILLEFYILMIYIVKIVNCFELYLKKKIFV